MWKRRIRQCELVDQKFREKKWERVKILTSFKEWEREPWSSVNGKDMLIEFAECKYRRRVKEKS
jgi:hypothetical protein